MINWFKQEFRTRDYQRYLRRAPSPAPAVAGQKAVTSNVPIAGGEMQIDSNPQPAWGADNNDNVKVEQRNDDNVGWGASNDMKDERENQQDNNFSGGRGRGRGGDRGGRGGGGSGCFKCG